MINSSRPEAPLYPFRSRFKEKLYCSLYRWSYRLSVATAKGYKPKLQKIYSADALDFTGRVCLFSHFDKMGQIDPQVLNYLTELKKLGFKIVVISTAADLDADSIDKSRKCCDVLLIKDNFGYDFGSWKAGLDFMNLDLTKIDVLLFANDSVYGPLHSLEPVFEKMQDGSYDLFGITDSLQLRYHVQSYFLAFSRNAINSPEFERFWRDFPYLSSKRSVIWAGETGLTQTFREADFKIGAYIENQKVREDHRDIVEHLECRMRFPGPLNICHPLWKLLITEYRCPFIKVNLLRENPDDVLDIYMWRTIIESNSDYETSLIQDHLDRFKAVSTRH